MDFAAIKFYILQYPGTVRLLGPVCIMVISQNLTNLIHQVIFRIGFKFYLAFHYLIILYSYSGNLMLYKRIKKFKKIICRNLN